MTREKWRWEYKVIETRDEGVPLAPSRDDTGSERPYAQRLALGLNELGLEGWELCAAQGTLFIFKRKTCACGGCCG